MTTIQYKGSFRLEPGQLYHFPHNSAYREELDFMLKLLDPRKKRGKKTYTLSEICKIMLIGEIKAKNFEVFHTSYHSNFTKHPPPDLPSLIKRFGPRAKAVSKKRHMVFMKFQKEPEKYYEELCKVQYKAKTWLGNWVEFPRDYCDFAAYCGLLPAFFKNPFTSSMADGYVVSDLMIDYLDGNIELEEILMNMKYSNSSINLDRYHKFNIEVRPFYSCLRILEELEKMGIRQIDYIVLSATVFCLRNEEEIKNATTLLAERFRTEDKIVNNGSLDNRFVDEAGRFSLSLLKFLKSEGLIEDQKVKRERYVSITKKGSDLLLRTPGKSIFYGHTVKNYHITPLLGYLLNLFEENVKLGNFEVKYSPLQRTLRNVISNLELGKILRVIASFSPSPIKSIQRETIRLNDLSQQYGVNPTTDYSSLVEAEFVNKGVGSIHPVQRATVKTVPPKRLMKDLEQKALESDGSAYEDILTESLNELKVGVVLPLGHKMTGKRYTDIIWEVPVIDSLTNSEKKILILIDAKAGSAIKSLDERVLIDDLKRTLELYRNKMEKILGVWVWIVDSKSLPTEGGHGGSREGVKSFIEKLNDIIPLVTYISRPMLVSALNIYSFMEYYSYLYNVLPKAKAPLNEVMSIQFWTWGTLFKPVKSYVFVLNDHIELKKQLFIL